MPKVSIIMPSLNVASYIEKCVESVINQTMSDIEILCVDAGSTDGTWEILKKYAEKDQRIRLLTSAKRSYGYQMNLGLREAVGEYIGIVETDDFILPEMYEVLYTCAKEQDAEFVKSDFDIFTTLSSGEQLFLRYSLKKYSCAKYNTIFTWEDYAYGEKTIDVFIWNGIYKRTFLQENDILFQETPGAAFQDCGFRYQVAMHVKRGFFLERSFYRYRRDNEDSSTYNSKCMLFNLAECKNLMRYVDQKGVQDQKQLEFFAKEIAIIASRPYVELLAWGQPDSRTSEALSEFREILKSFMECGNLNSLSVPKDLWTEIRMFVENPKFYEYYVNLKAEVMEKTTALFLKNIAMREQVILFGSGYVGSCAYALIRSNGIENVKAFCDNDQKKWNTLYMGCKVISLGEAIKKFPNAYFLITNIAHKAEIEEQLCKNKISRQQIGMYDQSTFPLHCVHMTIRSECGEEESKDRLSYS